MAISPQQLLLLNHSLGNAEPDAARPGGDFYRRSHALATHPANPSAPS